MRKLVSLIVSMLLLASLALAGCAATGTNTGGTAPKLSVPEALIQAQGAATALATLAQTSPMDDATKSQMQGYAAWANFALQAAGIIVPVAEAVAGS